MFEQVQGDDSPSGVSAEGQTCSDRESADDQAVEALNKGDIREFGQLMNASHLSFERGF